MDSAFRAFRASRAWPACPSMRSIASCATASPPVSRALPCSEVVTASPMTGSARWMRGTARSRISIPIGNSGIANEVGSDSACGDPAAGSRSQRDLARAEAPHRQSAAQEVERDDVDRRIRHFQPGAVAVGNAISRTRRSKGTEPSIDDSVTFMSAEESARDNVPASQALPGAVWR